MRILVLRGGALGDLILTLPLLREIRNSYQYASTELWGIYPQARLAAPAFVDRVERLDAAELAPLFVAGQMPPMVRSTLEAFDLAITFLSDPDMTIARNLATAGVKRVIGGSCRVRPGVHAVYQLAAVLDQLGLSEREDAATLRVAKQIVDIVAQGERDPERLTAATVEALTK